MHLGSGFVRRAQGGRKLGLSGLGLDRVGDKHFAHQQPEVQPPGGCGTGVPSHQGCGATTTFDLTDPLINNGLQFLQDAAQDAG